MDSLHENDAFKLTFIVSCSANIDIFAKADYFWQREQRDPVRDSGIQFGAR